MDNSPKANNANATDIVQIDYEAASASSSASRSAPRVIDGPVVSRDPRREASNSNHESQARNVLHQLSAKRPPEGVIVHSPSEVGIHIASPEHNMRRRPSSSLATGIGGLNVAEPGRSWTRAG